MKKYYSRKLSVKQKIYGIQIKAVACIVLLLLLYLEGIVIKDCYKEDFVDKKVSGLELITACLLPSLNYYKWNREKEAASIEKITEYEVPEWFFEDENAPIEPIGRKENSGDDLTQTVLLVPAKEEAVGRVKYEREQLQNPEYLLNHIFVVDSNTAMTKEELSVENLLDTPVWLEDIVSTSKKAPPKILIYHTHGSECFADSRPGVKEDSVIGMGSYLTELLEEKYHIPVYHDETLYDVIDGKLDRSRAYENAYANVTKILEENPSIEVVIDLHRDGVDEETHLVTNVNGKPTAKIMFLNGVSRSSLNGDIAYLENPNKKMNLAFSFQMYLHGKENYGDYIRKIYVRSLRYNLHLLPRTTLIEAGAQNNTIEEERNAMEPLAETIYSVLKGE